MKIVGIKTAARMRASETTGGGYFLHCLERSLLGRQSLFYMTLCGFDDNNGIVHHQADGEHQAEEGSVFRENPKTGKNANVPMSATGTASSGMSEARPALAGK